MKSLQMDKPVMKTNCHQKVFNSEEEMNKHLIGKPHKYKECKECNQVFACERNRKSHVKNMNPKTKKDVLIDKENSQKKSWKATKNHVCRVYFFSTNTMVNLKQNQVL